MKIDIDGPSEDELSELNQNVVARLRFVRTLRSHVSSSNAAVGE
jgi:hypothetical protein